MIHDPARAFGLMDGAAAFAIGVLFVGISARIPEPTRREFGAVFVGGAGAAYLNGGLGLWEFVFTTVATFVAWRGLRDARWIGVGWLLHVGWDVAHHLYGAPIVFFAPTSSAGCAVCDTVIAAWYLAGAPGWPERRPER